MTAVSVVGLGKLGACLMAVLATSPDNCVVGVDVSENTVKMINNGVAPVKEPGLQEFIKANSSRFTATKDFSRIADTDVTFVIVPTPSNPDGTFSNDYVLSAVDEIDKAIKRKNKPHLVVITSTVMPGTTGGVVAERLRSHRKPDVALCYSPHLIALGSVIRDMQFPDLVLIGQSTVEAGDWLQEVLMSVVLKDAPIAHLGLREAEIAKIAINAYITMKMSYANTLAEICEGMPQVDASEIARAVGLDSRIGGKYIQPATAFGGECVPPETLVLTEAGPRRIDGILPGDRVLAHDGRLHEVRQTMNRPYEGDLLRVLVGGFGGQPMVVTPEHPILGMYGRTPGDPFYETPIRGVRKKRLKEFRPQPETLAFKPAHEWRVGDCVLFPRPRITECIDKIDFGISGRPWATAVPVEMDMTPDFCRFLGYYLAEGSTWKSEVKIALHADEKQLAADIVWLVRGLFGAKARIKPKGGLGVEVVFKAATLARWLHANLGHSASDKRAPVEWLGLPEESLRHIVRGMWYGDGSNKDMGHSGHKTGGGFTWASTSRDLFNFLKLAMIRLSIPITTKLRPAHVDKNDLSHAEAYVICVRNPIAYDAMNELLPWLKVPYCGPGRVCVEVREEGQYGVIRSMETVPYRGSVWNLAVEGAESYVLEAGAVHNCFPRDCEAFLAMAKQAGSPAPLAQATIDINDRQIGRLANLLEKTTPLDQRIGVLGLTYKPSTPVITRSAGTAITKEMVERGYSVVIYDPLAMPELYVEFGDAVIHATSVTELLKLSQTVVVAQPCSEFANVGESEDHVIVDLWGMFPNKSVLRPGVHNWGLS